jgi:DNA topoisomerase-2
MACVESDASMMYESEFEDNVFDNSDDDFENVAPPKKGSKPAPKKSKDAINMVLSPSKNAGNVPAAAAAEKGNKKSVEQMYQKKTQLEHILLRPDTYIGSVEPLTTPMFVLDQETKKIVNRQVTYTPGLYNIFDESEYT